MEAAERGDRRSPLGGPVVSGGFVLFVSTLLFFTFVVCCTVAAVFQILAWSRHSLEGARVSIRALWRPEGHFDEVGIRQIRLSRALLTIGGVAYLTLGLLILVVNSMA
jgi:hypothetical protein